MAETPVLLGFVVSLVVGGTLFMLVRYAFPSALRWYRGRVEALESELSPKLSELFLLDVSTRSLAHLIELRIPLTIAVVYLLTYSVLFTAGSVVLVYFAPELVFRYLKHRRLEKFDEQLVDALNILSSSARAGLALVQSLETVAEKMPAPASEEFRLLVNEYKHGTPIDTVLENARDRLNRPNFSIVATAIIVNRERGGNLVEVLDKIASSLREIFRLEKKIKTETASVRLSAQLMAAMPVVIGIIFYLIEPSSMEMLFTHAVGTIILFFVVLLNVIALVIIRRIVNVEV